jgi:hypothetical protein
MEGATGVTTAEHLIHDTEDAEAIQAASVTIWSHVRIDAVES